MRPAIAPAVVSGVLAAILGGNALTSIASTLVRGPAARPETWDALRGLVVLISVTAVAVGLGRAMHADTPWAEETEAAGLFALPAAVLVIFLAGTWVSALPILGEWSWLIEAALYLAIYARCMYRASWRASAVPQPNLQLLTQPSATELGAQRAPTQMYGHSRRHRREPVSIRVPRRRA